MPAIYFLLVHVVGGWIPLVAVLPGMHSQEPTISEAVRAMESQR
jgi:hypothetical protein